MISIFGPALLTGISVLNTAVLGEERAKRVIAGMERGIQGECDEHLRIMNESGMTGRREGEEPADNASLERDKLLRKTVLTIRDTSYDFLEKQDLLQDPASDDTLSSAESAQDGQ